MIETESFEYTSCAIKCEFMATTVEPPKRGHFWNRLFGHCRDVVLYQR